MEFHGVKRNNAKVGRPRKQRGAGRPRNKYRSYKNAKLFVHKLNLNTFDEWIAFSKTDACPDDIPTRPDKVYEEWISRTDWLGTTAYVSFDEARNIVHQHKLTSKAQFDTKYEQLFQRPYLVPKQPHNVYNEWMGWKDFLGYEKVTGRIDMTVLAEKRDEAHEQYREYKYRPFMDAVKYVAQLNLRDYNDWLEWRSSYKHKDLPWRPDLFYKTEWQGWKVFLGHDPLLALLDGTAILFIARHAQDPMNVYRIGLNRYGLKDTIIKAQEQQLKLIRVYQQDNNDKQEVDEILRRNCKSYDGNGAFIVPNIYDLMNDLFAVLPTAK